jgi:hypothetical protein
VIGPECSVVRSCAWRFVSRCVWAADDTTTQWALAIDAMKALRDEGEKVANAASVAFITTWETRSSVLSAQTW